MNKNIQGDFQICISVPLICLAIMLVFVCLEEKDKSEVLEI